MEWPVGTWCDGAEAASSPPTPDAVLDPKRAECSSRSGFISYMIALQCPVVANLARLDDLISGARNDLSDPKTQLRRRVRVAERLKSGNDLFRYCESGVQRGK
jgi:hypothetical protein